MELDPGYRGPDGFWRGFNRYVEDYYRIDSTQGWCRIIEFFSSSRAGAFDTFFQRYDEYLAAYREGKTPRPGFDISRKLVGPFSKETLAKSGKRRYTEKRI